MNPPKIIHSVLVVSPNRQLLDFLTDILPPDEYDPIHYEQTAGGAKRLLLTSDFDIVLVNTPLADEFGTDLAVTAVEKGMGALLLCRRENYEEVSYNLESAGVLTIPKPVTQLMVRASIGLINATTARLKKIEKKNQTLQEKMADIRTINHAKWLLIENLGMTEKDAHHYIEKQSMDTRLSRREIAERIIRTYDK